MLRTRQAAQIHLSSVHRPRAAHAQTGRVGGQAPRGGGPAVPAILSRSPLSWSRLATTSPVSLRGGTSYPHCPACSLRPPLPGGRRLRLEPGGQRPGRISGRKCCGARGGSGDLGEFSKLRKVSDSRAPQPRSRLSGGSRAGSGSGVTARAAVRAARAWRAVASSLGPPTTVPLPCPRLWPGWRRLALSAPQHRGALLSAPLFPPL